MDCRLEAFVRERTSPVVLWNRHISLLSGTGRAIMRLLEIFIYFFFVGCLETGVMSIALVDPLRAAILGFRGHLLYQLLMNQLIVVLVLLHRILHANTAIVLQVVAFLLHVITFLTLRALLISCLTLLLCGQSTV